MKNESLRTCGLKIGDRVHWDDPDDNLCSGWGVVAVTKRHPHEDGQPFSIISLAMEHGGEVEVLRRELRKEGEE